MAQKITVSAGRIVYRVNTGTMGQKYPITLLPEQPTAHLILNGDATTERSSYAVQVAQWNAVFDAAEGDTDKMDAALTGQSVILTDKPKATRAGRAKVDQKSRLAKVSRR